VRARSIAAVRGLLWGGFCLLCLLALDLSRPSSPFLLDILTM